MTETLSNELKTLDNMLKQKMSSDATKRQEAIDWISGFKYRSKVRGEAQQRHREAQKAKVEAERIRLANNSRIVFEADVSHEVADIQFGDMLNKLDELQKQYNDAVLVRDNHKVVSALEIQIRTLKKKIKFFQAESGNPKADSAQLKQEYAEITNNLAGKSPQEMRLARQRMNQIEMALRQTRKVTLAINKML